MPVGSLRAENSWLSLLVEALRCVFLGAGLIRTKCGIVCAHYPVATRTVSIEEKTGHCDLPCSTV